VNIGTEEKPKFVNIGDYWSEETIEKIVDLLREYQDLFPTNFSEMKGIHWRIRRNEDSIKTRCETLCDRDPIE
jgi:hypothetical protein